MVRQKVRQCRTRFFMSLSRRGIRLGTSEQFGTQCLSFGFHSFCLFGGETAFQWESANLTLLQTSFGESLKKWKTERSDGSGWRSFKEICFFCGPLVFGHSSLRRPIITHKKRKEKIKQNCWTFLESDYPTKKKCFKSLHKQLSTFTKILNSGMNGVMIGRGWKKGKALGHWPNLEVYA